MKQYHELLRTILDTGWLKSEARENMPNTMSVFGYQSKYDLSEGFPIVTTKEIPFRLVVVELLHFLRGETTIDYLHNNNCHIWDEDCENFDPVNKNYLGKIYGYQWRNFAGKVDQLKEVIKSLKNNPNSRRHIISAWNPLDIHNKELALPPCHSFIQFNCREVEAGKYILDCQMYQRSADAFLGVPFNISSYALLTHIIAEICNMEVGNFIHTFGDAHIYQNHLSQVIVTLSRQPYELPTLRISDRAMELLKNCNVENLDSIILSLQPSDFRLEGYRHHPKIKAKLSTGKK